MRPAHETQETNEVSDKSTIGRKVKPKGKAYCDTPNTSCYYNEKDVCVNCGRPKGWRVHRMHRVQHVKLRCPGGAS